MNRSPKQRQKGMTLVEVLVAFAILAGVVVSVMGLIGQNTNFIISSEERMLAGVAADNLLTEALAKRATPGAGAEEGEIMIGGRAFVFTQTVIEAGGGAMQIEYQLRRADDVQVLARASALKGR